MSSLSRIAIPLSAALVLASSAAVAQREPTTSALADALCAYFASGDPRGPELAAVTALADGKLAELQRALRDKTFVRPHGPIARRGRIDAAFRFVDDPDAMNPALFHGPALDGALHPLVVYVPDAIDSTPYARELQRAAEDGLFVLLVPDERRDNRWLSNQHELDRHTGPLRDLLLQHPIDPDRIYFVGSGRGGHAAWDVGLLRSSRWAGVYPCNGGLIHEGGYQTTGGVFVENGKDLTIFSVYNTTFDHGIESCRHAARLLRQWNCAFDAVEEPAMRVMPIAEAMQRLRTVTRQAHRTEITKRFNRLPDGSHHWLTALDRRPGEWDPSERIVLRGPWPKERDQQRVAIWDHVAQRCARLHGAIRGNAVRIEARGIGRLRLWLDPELLDFERPVTITVNGHARPPVKPTRRPDLLLQRVHATGDTQQLYLDHVDLVVPK